MHPAGPPTPLPPASPPAVRADSGFSILEILMALFLMVLIVLAVSRTTRTTSHVHQASYFMEQAAAYAQAKMALLQAASLRTVAAGKDTILTPNRFAYNRSWTIVDKGIQKQVQVMVSWKAGGKVDSVTLTTLVK